MTLSNFWTRYFKTTKISFPLLNYSIKINQYQEIFEYYCLNKSFHFLAVYAGAMWRHVIDKLIRFNLSKKKTNLFLSEKIIGSGKFLPLISKIGRFSPVNPTSLRILGMISTERGRIPPSPIKYHRNVLLSWNLVAIKFHLITFQKTFSLLSPGQFYWWH